MSFFFSSSKCIFYMIPYQLGFLSDIRLSLWPCKNVLQKPMSVYIFKILIIIVCHLQKCCDNTLLAGPHYLNLPNYSWPSDRLVVSLISGQEYFTFPYRHTKHNIHNREGGRKENKQTLSWVSPKCKKGEVCDTFLRNSHKVTSQMLTHLLMLANLAWVHTSYQSPALSCWLPCSAFFSWLSASLFCSLFCSLGPSFLIDN